MTSCMRFTDVWNLVLGNTVGPRINEARQSATAYLQYDDHCSMHCLLFILSHIEIRFLMEDQLHHKH